MDRGNRRSPAGRRPSRDLPWWRHCRPRRGRPNTLAGPIFLVDGRARELLGTGSSREECTMGRKTRNLAWTVLVLAVVAAPRAFGAPVHSDLATAQLGGGCYPTGIQPGPLDMLAPVTPDGAPIQNGRVVDPIPIVIHGSFRGRHGV